MENYTAKHFVLQLGSLVSLYLSVSFLLVLIFGVVNLLFPDAVDAVWEVESASSQIRLGIAMTIVFFPTYIILTRLVNKARRLDSAGGYLGLTKWLIYLSLLVAGIALLVDLVVVITTFLEGDVTQRFVLKALSVLVVIGAGFYYYLLDARGHWLQKEKQSTIFAGVTTLIVLIFVVSGFSNIETPTQVREQKIDDTQILGLQNIQWQIQNYLSINNSLPTSLDDAYVGMSVPQAPEGRVAYKYEITDKGFALCATFVGPSRKGEYFASQPIMPAGKETVITNPDNWEHGVGEWCFERVVLSQK